MSPSSRRVLNWLLTLVLAGFIVRLACSHEFYLSSIVSPYSAAALAGAAIIYACIRPHKELLRVVAAAIVLWILEFIVAGTRASGIFLIVPSISFLGLSAFFLLGVRSI